MSLIPTSAGGASSEPYTTVPAKREITIRDLLNHTAGITNGSGDFSELYRKSGIREIRSTPGATIGDMVKKLAALPLQYHPGEVFLYGSSHDVLGYLVEVISGMGFDEFLLERVFKPLGMKDTYFYVPEEKLSRVASLYEPNSNGGLDKVPDRILLRSQTYFSGGGGLSSTISDYAQFAQMMLNGGELDGIRLLSRKTVELMTTNSIG
ncbi:MAG TPA: serine hydrolase domain-containing protein, partial [Anaerolineae bacterium]|nr:serine hydrolase domain-containing protein [Anaerolineae bacterium]